MQSFFDTFAACLCTVCLTGTDYQLAVRSVGQRYSELKTREAKKEQATGLQVFSAFFLESTAFFSPLFFYRVVYRGYCMTMHVVWCG